jgi:hypothetical protein
VVKFLHSIGKKITDNAKTFATLNNHNDLCNFFDNFSNVEQSSTLLKLQ